MRKYLDQRLKLQMLRVAEAIDAHGSILKAAAALSRSQPSLTKSLHELEEILQVRLFERHTRGVRITEAGHRLVRSGRKILAEVLRLDEELDLLSRPGSGLIAVGASPVVAAGILPGLVMRLKSRFPLIYVRLQEARTVELLPLLASGEVDVVIGRLYEPALPDGLVREPLWTEPVALLAKSSHPIFQAGPPTLESVLDYEFVLPTITQKVGQEIEQALSLHGLKPAIRLRSNSYSLIREVLFGTDMISAIPRWS